MSVLSLSKINKFYSNVQILKDISFFVDKNDKLAIIGKNGVGKTTLLKIICGLEDYDSGEIHLSKQAKIGYMQQISPENMDITLLEYCMNVFDELINMETQIMKMEEELSHFSNYDDEFQKFLHEYEQKMEAFEHSGGLVFKSKLRGILQGLGFSESEHDRKLSTLSGGQLNRLNLARLIASEPELLILDEPTNHLDITSVSWLENYLKNYPNPLIFVSHDRYFIDAVANKTLELELGMATLYKGNYSEFKHKREDVKRAQLRAYEKQQDEINKQEELIRSFVQRGTQKLAKRAKSREKALEKLDIIENPHSENTDIKLNFEISRHSGKDVLFIEELCKGYDAPILQNMSANIYRGQKIGIMGKNGAGKTTLFKLIKGELKPDSGNIKFGHHVDLSYYEQNLDSLNPDHTILQEIVEYFPEFDDTDARKFLGSLLFTKDDVFKQIKNLSGGEKARVTLAKLLLDNSNFMLLDEPTNHLDIYSCEILEEALKEYDGTLCVISHDRYFLNAICDNIWILENLNITPYIGNYDAYMDKQQILSKNAQEMNHLSLNQESNSKPSKKSTTPSKWELNKQQERDRNKKRRELEALELSIQDLETQIQEIDKNLCLEDIYSDHIRAAKLSQQKLELQNQLDEKYEHWERLSEVIQ